MKKRYIVPKLGIVAKKYYQCLLAGSKGDISSVGTSGTNITTSNQFGGREDDGDDWDEE